MISVSFFKLIIPGMKNLIVYQHFKILVIVWILTDAFYYQSQIPIAFIGSVPHGHKARLS